MKKLTTILLTLFTTALLVPTVSAMYFFASEDVVQLPLISDDAYLAGNNVNITNPITGDLYAAGASITIDAPINEDAFLIAETITINAPIGDDVKLVARNITINAKIADNAIIAAQSITITNQGSLGHDAQIWAQNITINGTVKGNLTTLSQTLSLGTNASVGGDLSYSAPQTDIQESQVSGEISYNATVEKAQSKWEESEGQLNRMGRIWNILQNVVFSFIPFLIISIALLFTFPNMLQRVADQTNEHFWMNLGIGLALLLGTPIILFLLLFTVVGIPLALLGGAFYFLSLFVVKCFTGYWIGAKILPIKKATTSRKLLSITVGLFVYYLLYQIPFVGWIAGFLLFSTTLGSIVLTKKETYLLMRKKKIV